MRHQALAFTSVNMQLSMSDAKRVLDFLEKYDTHETPDVVYAQEVTLLRAECHKKVYDLYFSAMVRAEVDAQYAIEAFIERKLDPVERGKVHDTANHWFKVNFGKFDPNAQL